MKCPEIKPDNVYKGDSIELLRCLPDESIDLVITSPPYANKRKKHYSSIDPDGYKDWFVPFAREIKRVLKPSGSFVFNIKEHVKDGNRHPYVFDTVKAIQDEGLNWNETYIWNKTNPYPIKPIKRFKDAFEYVFHFVKEKDFTFNPRSVMTTGDPASCKRLKMKSGKKKIVFSEMNNYRKNAETFFKNCDEDGTYHVFPTNVITGPVESNSTWKHPARFPKYIPDFFVKLLSNEGDVVLDPFAGSGTTNVASVENCRKTIGFDLKPEYVDMANERIGKMDAKCNI